MLESLNTLIAFALIMTVVSLLITIVVQMVSTALNLRGRNLAKAMTQILQTTAPGASEEVKKSAQRVTDYLLTRPYLSDHAFFNRKNTEGPPEADFVGDYKLCPFRLYRFATAVRPQEIFDTLLELAKVRTDAQGKPIDESTTLAKDARRLLEQMGIPTAALDNVGQTILILNQAQEALKTDPSKAPLMAAIEAGKKGIIATARAAATAESKAWERFNFWFEATQDRAQQWFAMHTRICTIFFAAIFAFTLDLDTIEIYRQVSTNAALRDKLVASAGALTGQAEKILADTPSVIQEAFNVWRSTNAALTTLVKALAPQATETRGSFLARLEAAAGQTNATNLVASFATVLDDTVQKQIAQQSAQFTALKGELEKSGFPLLVPGGRWANEKDANGRLLVGSALARHFWGMLMSAGLLTLGAPFWFNVLKSLANLRSMVARDISKEEQTKMEAATKPNAAAPPSPTTTLPPSKPATPG